MCATHSGFERNIYCYEVCDNGCNAKTANVRVIFFEDIVMAMAKATANNIYPARLNTLNTKKKN